MQTAAILVVAGGLLLACGSRPTHRTAAEGSASARGADVRPVLDIVLAPVCGADGEPSALDVELTTAWHRAEPPTFRISDQQGGPHGIRELILEPKLTDASGEIAVSSDVAVDPRSQESKLHIRAARTATGKVTFRYRARSIATSDRGSRFGLRHDASAMGGAGDGFLLLPAVDEPLEMRLRWSIVGCKADLVALSALGVGVGPHRFVAPPDALRQAGFFLGRPDTVLVDDGAMHLHFSFFGKPAFDTRVAAKYASDVLRAEREVFGDEDATPFYAFMRTLPEMGKHVVGGGNAYGYTSVVGPDAPWDARMRDHIAHELLHHWIGVGLWMRDAERVSAYWFSEGFAVHYSRVIPLRVGLLPPAEFLEQLNKVALPFYASPHRGASNAQIEKGLEAGIGDPVLGLIPYWRGALYAAELDAAIRTTSGGARSLDDLMQELHRRAKVAPRNESGYPELPEETFRQLVHGELGEPGAQRFDAVVRRGELPRPPSAAFGPCFERRERRVAEYERGFDFDASLAEPRAIRGLVKGSSAERAGIAEGDTLLELAPGPREPRDPTREIRATLQKKDGKTVIASYLPARPGSSVEVLEWARAAGVPDQRCAER